MDAADPAETRPPESADATSPGGGRTQDWRAAGVGLLLASAACTLLGTRAVPVSPTWTTAADEGFRVAGIAMALGVLGAVLADGWRARRGVPAMDPRRRSSRVWTAAVLLIGLLVLATVCLSVLVRQAAQGWPGAGMTLLVVGALAGLLGCALILGADRGTGGRDLASISRGRRLGIGLSAALVVGLAGTAGAVLVPRSALEASTAPPRDMPAVGDEFSAVAWEVPMDHPVLDVRAAGPGVIVLRDDGLVALDGESGAERWRYLREGADASLLEVSPDGRTAVLQWRPGEGGRTEFVFLDTMTGEALHSSSTGESVPLLGSFTVPMGGETTLTLDADETRFSGYSLRTGEKMWEYRIPDGCEPASGVQRSRSVGPTLVALACRDEDGTLRGEVLAFADGPEPVWTWSTTGPIDEESAGPGFSLDTSLDGTAARVSLYGATSGSELIGLDPVTGAEVPTTDDILFDLRQWSPDYQVGREVEDGPLVVRDREGTVLAETEGCGGGNLTPTDTRVVCLDLPGIEEIAAGSAIVRSRDYDGSLTEVPVDLGGPFTTTDRGIDRAQLVRAPGGWVAWSPEVPSEGSPSVVVGVS